MARRKSEWAQPWKTVAKHLCDVCGGTWPSVLSAIEAQDDAALTSWFPGQLTMTQRRDRANKQIGIGDHAVRLRIERSPTMS